MIERPVGLKLVAVDLVFNFQSFKLLEVDLNHINKNKRSSYALEEIKNIVVKLLFNKLVMPSAIREYENEACSYYVLKDYYMRKKYKIVFCICSDRPENIGIITLYRI